ncbi:hypothetical protein Gotri_027385, partial [Gossypium trilobum]|nr:hypothetical protein [Gossypium trilobum]
EISAILSRGSISFGRYADDSIAWEKRSVFTYNRCEEELQKFQAPGFVAQKTAYFNEFYKRVGVVEALPAHQQNTRQYGPSQETQENSKLRGIGFNDAVAEKEDKPSNASQIQISDSQGISNNMEPCCQEVKNCSTENNDATIEEGMKVCRNTVEVENSFEEASVSHPPLSEGNPKCAQRKSIASSKVKQIFNKTIKHGNKVKDKGTVASAITNKAKVCSITTKVAKVLKILKEILADKLLNHIAYLDYLDYRKASLQQKKVPKMLFEIFADKLPNRALAYLDCLDYRKLSVQWKVPQMLTQNAVRNMSRQTTERHFSLPSLSKLLKSVPSMKESTQNAVRNISRQTTERHSSLPRSSKLLRRVPSMKESTPNAVRNITRQTTKRHSSLPRPSRLSKSVPSMKESTPDAVRNISGQTIEPQAYVDCPDYRKVVAWCHLAPALEKLKPSHVQKEPNKNQSCQCKFPALK